MRIFSYSGCQSCLVQANCTCICDEYKISLKRKYKIDVECVNVALKDAEECVFVKIYLEMLHKGHKPFPDAIIKEITPNSPFCVSSIMNDDQLLLYK